MSLCLRCVSKVFAEAGIAAAIKERHVAATTFRLTRVLFYRNAVDTAALRTDDVSGLVSHDLHISGLVNQQQSQHRRAKQRTVHSQIVHHVSGLIMPGQFPHP